MEVLGALDVLLLFWGHTFSWLCPQDLKGLRDPYVVLGTESRSAVGETGAPSRLCLSALDVFFKEQGLFTGVGQTQRSNAPRSRPLDAVLEWDWPLLWAEEGLSPSAICTRARGPSTGTVIHAPARAPALALCQLPSCLRPPGWGHVTPPAGPSSSLASVEEFLHRERV